MTAGRVGWVVLGLLALALATIVSIRYGVSAIIATVVFLAVPWLPWGPLRKPWIPLTGLVACTLWPVWAPLFGAGLGWLAGIATVRVVRGLDDRDAPAEPGRLGTRILGLDLSRGPEESHLRQESRPDKRRRPGPQAGRASIPRPEQRSASVPEPEAGAPRTGGPHPDRQRPDETQSSDGSPEQSRRAAEPRPAQKPRPPKNRLPRAASKPPPWPPARPESGTGVRPDAGPETGSGR